jgi:hypothetical protein
MSLILKVAGANFSQSGLPKLKQTILGFPAEGLAGLYLFEDGSVDTAHTGEFLDSSGRANNASLFSDFSAPVNRSYGLEVTDGAGLILNSGIKQPSQFTILVCANLSMPTDSHNGYPTYTGDTGNGIPSSKASSGNNSPRLAINTALQGADDSNGLYSANSEMLRGKARIRVPEGTYGSANQPALMALSVGLDSLMFRTLSGFKAPVSDPDIQTGYAAVNEDVLLGLWAHGSPGGISGRLYGFAVYERALNDDEMSEAMAAMNTRVSARGVVVVS